MVLNTAGGVLGKVPGAVVPEADVVKILDPQGLGGGAGTAVNKVDVGDGGSDGVRGQAGQVEDGGVDVDLRGVCSEEVEVVERAVALVCAAEADNDEADERRDGSYHREEDARETACFTHNDDCVACSEWMSTKVGVERETVESYL